MVKNDGANTPSFFSFYIDILRLLCAVGLRTLGFCGGFALDKIADEHDDGEEDQEAAAGLCALAVQ